MTILHMRRMASKRMKRKKKKDEKTKKKRKKKRNFACLFVPFTHSSSALTEVGTICPPGHMQKE